MKDKIANYWGKLTAIQKALVLGLLTTSLILYSAGLGVEAILLAFAVVLVGGSAALLLGRESTLNKFSVGVVVGGFIVLSLALMGTVEVLSPLSFVIVLISGIACLAAYDLFSGWNTFDVGVGGAVIASLVALAFTGLVPVRGWVHPTVLVLMASIIGYIIYQLYNLVHIKLPQANLGEYNFVYYPAMVLLAGVVTMHAISLIPVTPAAYCIADVVDIPVTWVSSNVLSPVMNWVGLGTLPLPISALPLQATGEMEGTIYTSFAEEERRFTYIPAKQQSTVNVQVITPGAMAIAPTAYVGNPIWVSRTRPYAVKHMTLNLKAGGMSIPVDVLYNREQATISSTYLIPSATALKEGQVSNFVLMRMPKGTYKVRFSVVSLDDENVRIHVSKPVVA